MLRKIRTAKTQAHKSLRWEVERLEIRGPEIQRRALEPVLPDVLRAGSVRDGAEQILEGSAPETDRFSVGVTLLADEPS